MKKTAKVNSFIREIEVKFKTLDTEKIHTSTPEAVARFIEDRIGNECREHFVILCINPKNMIVGYSLISIGTVSEAIIHPREVFIAAIMTKASGIIIAHNHPSGVIMPSAEDRTTTSRLCEAGKIIGIPLIDHIIVGFDNNGSYYSMKENGYI